MGFQAAMEGGSVGILAQNEGYVPGGGAGGKGTCIAGLDADVVDAKTKDIGITPHSKTRNRILQQHIITAKLATIR